MIVQAVGNGDGVDLEGLLTEDSVRVERTFADEDTPPTTDPTSTASTGRTTFTLTLPDPLEIDTGPVMYVSTSVVCVAACVYHSSPLLLLDFMPS